MSGTNGALTETFVEAAGLRIGDKGDCAEVRFENGARVTADVIAYCARGGCFVVELPRYDPMLQEALEAA